MFQLFSDNELAFAVDVGNLATPKGVPIEPADVVRLGLICDTELEMGMARGEAMGEQVAGHDEEQEQEQEGSSCLEVERCCE